MTSKRTSLLLLPLLQFFMLVTVYLYFFLAEKIRHIFDMMNVEPPSLTRFLFYSPGVYTYPTVIISLTGLVIWLWATKRLESKLAVGLKNFYLVFLSVLTIIIIYAILTLVK